MYLNCETCKKIEKIIVIMFLKLRTIIGVIKAHQVLTYTLPIVRHSNYIMERFRFLYNILIYRNLADRLTAQNGKLAQPNILQLNNNMNLNSHNGKNFTGDLTVHPWDETNLANVNSINKNNNFGTCDKTPYYLVIKIAVVLNEEYILDTSSKNPLDPNKINGRLTQEDKQLLFNELKNILKCKLTKNVIDNISKFANTIIELQNLIKIHGDKNSDPKIQFKEQQKLRKLIPVYNNRLNIFKNYIKESYDSNTHHFTILKLEMLHNLHMLCHHPSLKFEEYTLNKLNIDETTTSNNIVVNTNRLNYDGYPINDVEHKIIFTIPETTMQKDINKKSNGVKFGFSDFYEFMSFLKCSIEEATINQLSYKKCTGFASTNSNKVNGSLILQDYVFSIDLNITHGFKVGKINTTSSKIMHWLTNNDLKKSHISSDILFAFNYPELFKYNDLVTKKIYQLINQKYNDPEFPFCTIQCYRQNCQHYNIYKKGVNQQGNLLKCIKCNISEFCTLCEKTYHGNTPCNITVDEQNELWISENTKACPNPNCKKRIEKKGGCNHMTCKQCSAHFCWLCNQIYTPNDVNNHYRGMDPFGGCINQVLVNNQGNNNQDQGNNNQNQGNNNQNQGNNNQDQGNNNIDQGNNNIDQGNNNIDQGNNMQDQGNNNQQDEDEDDDIPELEEIFDGLPILEHRDMLLHRVIINNQDLVLDRMIATQLELLWRREQREDDNDDIEDRIAQFREDRSAEFRRERRINRRGNNP